MNQLGVGMSHLNLSCNWNYSLRRRNVKKGSLGKTVKLLPCYLEITGSSYENNLLQSRVKLCIIDHFQGSRVDRRFVHRIILLKISCKLGIEQASLNPK